MTTNGNGAAGMSLGDASRLQGMLNNNGSTTTVAGTFGTNAQVNSLGYYYPYQWQAYYPDYNFANRVASLEGEVRVLREMVAALLSGKAPKASSAKR